MVTTDKGNTMKPGIEVFYEGRPAVVMTAPEVGANGATMVGVRFTDVPRWQDVPGFPGMQKPTRGSCVIADVADLYA